MKTKRWLDGEGLIILTGLLVALVLSVYFPVPKSLLPPLAFQHHSQLSEDILTSGKYNSSEKIVFFPGEDRFSVWMNSGVEKNMLPFSEEVTLNELQAYAHNKLMYVPTSPIWHSPVGDFKKAISVRIKDKKTKEVFYRTYFDEKENFHLPVLALTINAPDFFDAQQGMSVQGLKEGVATLRSKWWEMPGNYKNKGKEYATEGYLEYFKPNGEQAYAAFTEIRIHGNNTRAFPQKSLRITAQKNAEGKTFEYDFFGTPELSSNRSLILRNGGNDWGRTLFSDALMQKLVENLGLETQAFTPVIMYLNGEYWGIYSLRQKMDEDFLSAKYHCKKKQVTFIETDEFKNGKKKHYKDLTDLLSELKNKNGDEAYHILSKEIDVQNFIHYIFAETYFANTDWPFNNCKYYKIDEGKWRWAIYDLDYGYGYTGNPGAYQADIFSTLMNSKVNTAKIFRILMKSDNFKEQFRNRSLALLEQNLSGEKQVKAIDEYANLIRTEIPDHTRRWRKPVSVAQWEYYVQEMKTFVHHRKTVYIKQLSKYFN